MRIISSLQKPAHAFVNISIFSIGLGVLLQIDMVVFGQCIYIDVYFSINKIMCFESFDTEEPLEFNTSDHLGTLSF